MSTIQSPTEKRENFPSRSFRYLEWKLQKLRSKIMKRATDIAKSESPPKAEVFNVQTEHIDKAIIDLLPALWDFTK